jgi:tripartite-type tricarboxylate transporter receptor subunit TctC
MYENADESALHLRRIKLKKMEKCCRVWNSIQLAMRLGLVVILVSSVFSRGAFAENYPERRITLIVPHPAGAQADAVARLLADRLSKIWNQPIVVENRVGANGNLGAVAVARAAPDGYTVMLTTTGPLAINSALFRSLDFDPQKDFDPVAIVCTASTLIGSNMEFPAMRLSDIITRAREEPGKLSMGTGGVGTGGHFILAELNKMAGIDITHIPYRGSMQADIDLASGAVPLAATDATAMLPLIAGGKIRPLATAGTKRLPQLPDVPTVAEAALPGFDVAPWIALVAPHGTPTEIINKLNSAVYTLLGDPKNNAAIIEQACNPMPPMSTSEVAAFIRKEIPLWAQRVRDAHLDVQ